MVLFKVVLGNILFVWRPYCVTENNTLEKQNPANEWLPWKHYTKKMHGLPLE